jgi:hypothetical protein
MSASPRRRRRKGLFMTWAGDSLWRRFVAWLGQTAIIVAVGAIGIALIWFVLYPMMIDNLVEVFGNSAR